MISSVSVSSDLAIFMAALLVVSGCDDGFPCADDQLEVRANELGPVSETAYVCDGELVGAGFCFDEQYAFVDPYAGTGCPGTLIRIGRASAIGGLYLSLYVHRNGDGPPSSVTAQFEMLVDEGDEDTKVWAGATGWLAFEQAGPGPDDRFAGRFQVSADGRGSVAGTFDTDDVPWPAPFASIRVLE